MGKLYSLVISKIIPAFLVCVLVIVSAVVLVDLHSPVANAATTGECGADTDTSSTMNSKTVTFGGKKWVVIGMNAGGTVRGISGPDQSVTLLLDSSSALTTPTKYATSDQDLDYSTSVLKTKMEEQYNLLGPSEKQSVISRTLPGTTGTILGSDFTSNDVYGADVPDVHFWPLSIREAVQLKGNVRRYSSGSTQVWWTRSPSLQSQYGHAVWAVNFQASGSGSNGGHIVAEDTLNNAIDEERNMLRPAFYMDYTTFSSLDSTTLSTMTIGACPLNPSIKLAGATYDVVGINDGGTASGVSLGGNNTATLVLSNQSKNKPTFSNGTIKETWVSSGNDSSFANSLIKQKLDEYNSALNDPKIIARDLTDISVNNQKIWLLSKSEVAQLDFNERIFYSDWWQRTPDDATHVAMTRYDGVVSGQTGNSATANNSNRYVVRPAMLYQLTGEIKNLWQNKDNSWNGVAYKTPVTSSCFTFTAPANLVQDNTAKTATVAKSGTCNLGGGVSNPRTYYQGIDGTSYIRQANAPSALGKYKVTVDGDESSDYNSYSDIEVGTFEIVVPPKVTITPSFSWSYGSLHGNYGTDCEKYFDGNASLPSNCSIASTNYFDITFSGLTGGDSIQKGTAVALGSSQNYQNYPNYTYNGWYYRNVLKQSSAPIFDFNNSDASDNKGLQVCLQMTQKVYEKYDWSVSTGANGVGCYDAFSDAGKILKSTNTINVTANNMTIKVGESLPTAAQLTAKLTSGAVGGDGDTKDPYTKFTGSLVLSSGCSNATVGTCQILRGTLDPINYSSMNFTAGTLTIVDGTPQNDLEVADPGSKTYGAANFNLALTTGKTGSGTGAVTYSCTDGCSGTSPVAEVTSTGAVAIKGAGTFKVKAEKAGDTTFSSKTSSERTITISKKTASVQSGAVTVTQKTYDGTTSATISNGSVAASYITGRINSDDITATCTTAVFANANAGTNKTVNVSGCTAGGTKAGNYNLATTTETTGTINKADQTTLALDSVSGKTYGDSAFSLTYSANPGTEGTYSFACVANCATSGTSEIVTLNTSTGQVTINKAGTGVKVKATRTPDSASNYNAVTSADLSFDIAKKNVTVNANDVSVNVNANLPTLTTNNVAVPSGLVGSDTISDVVSGVPSYGSSATAGTTGSGSCITTAQNTSGIANCIVQGSVVAKTDGNYSITWGTNGKLIVTAKASQPSSFVMNDITSKTYGDSSFALSATGASESPTISFSVVSGPATISNTTLSITGAGTIAVKACATETTTYAASCTPDKSFSVGKKTTNVTGLTATSRNYAQSDSTVQIVTSGATFSGKVGTDTISLTGCTGNMSSDDAGVNKAVSITGCTLDATSANNYTLGTVASTTVTINKINQTISFATPAPNETYTGSGYTYSQTPTLTSAPGSGTVTYSIESGGTGAATITQSTGVLSNFTKAGTITVKATKAADTNYNAATATYTLTLAKANRPTLSITDPGTITYGDSAFTLSTSGGGGTSPTFSCGSGCSTTADTEKVRLNTTNGQVTIKNAGTAVVKASIAGNDLYNEVNATDLALTINRADITVTATDKSVMVGSSTLPDVSTLEYTHTALKYSDTKASVFSGSLAWASGGSCVTSTATTIPNCIEQGSLSVNSNYNISTFNKGSLIVTAKSPQPNTFVLADITNKTYGDSDFTVSASGAQGGGSLTYEITAGDGQFASISGNSITVIAPTPALSPVKVRACVPETTSYAAGCTLEKSFTVNPFTTSVSNIKATSRVYDPSNTGVAIDTTSATFSKPTSKPTDSLVLQNCLGSIASPDAGNNKEVTLANCSLGGAAAANYTLGTLTGNGTGGKVVVNITKADQASLTVNDVTGKKYGDAAFTLSATGGTTSGTITYECVSGCATSGTSEIVTLNTTNGQVTINKAGSFSVKAKRAGNGNYNEVVSSAKSITIAPFETTVSGITAQNRAYQAGNTTVTLVVSGASFTRPSGKSGDALSLSNCVGSIPNADVGSKTVTVSSCTLSGAAANNYTLLSVNSPTVTITGAARTLTASASSNSFDWKGTTPTLSATASAGGGTITWECTSGCPSVASVAANGTISAVQGVGTFKVKAKITAADNYSEVFSNELTLTTLKSNQAALSITSVTGKKYGDAAFALSTTGGSTNGAVTWSCVSGCATSGTSEIITLNATTGQVTINKAGSFSVKAKMAGNANYNDVEATTTITIGKAQLTVTADDLTVIQGGGLPNATTLTYSVVGLVGSDTKAMALEGSLGYNAGCDTITLGTSPDCIEQGSLVAKSAGNYEIATFNKGKLIVVDKYPQPSTFVMNNITNKTYGDAAFTVSSTGAVGSGALTYEVLSGPASISSNQLTIIGAGNVEVRACITADASNAAGCTPSVQFTVNKFITSVAGVAATSRVYTPGDTSVSVSTASATFTKPTSRVSDDLTLACNASGNMADDNAGTNKTVTLTGCVLGGIDVANYELGVINLVKVNITKASQAALALDVSSITQPLKVNAEGVMQSTGGSGQGAVTYQVVSGLALITLDKVMPLAAGTITLKAVKAADNNYLEVESAPESITAYDDVKIDDVANGGDNTLITIRGTNGFDIPQEWKLVVKIKDLTRAEAEFDAFNVNIGSDNELDKLYDIHFIDTANNDAVITTFDPNARFDVVVPSVLKDTKTEFKVWHQHAGEDVKEHSIDVRRVGSGQDLRFTVNKFSLFGISYLATPSGGSNDDDSNQSGGGLANTGTSGVDIALSVFALLMVAGALWQLNRPSRKVHR